MAIKWTEAELDYIHQNYHHQSYEDLRMGLFKLNKLNNINVDRSKETVKQKVRNLGLKKDCTEQVYNAKDKIRRFTDKAAIKHEFRSKESNDYFKSFTQDELKRIRKRKMT